MNAERTIQGFKFPQQAYKWLYLELNEKEFTNAKERKQRLQCSEISLYVLYHSLCDEFGRILEESLSFRELARKYDLNPSTLCIAHHKLIQRGVIQEVQIQSQTYIEISHYAEWNTAEKENKERTGNQLNYFKVPVSLLYVLKDFIRSKDAAGLVSALSLGNQNYRQFSIRSSNEIEMLKNTLKRKAKKTNKTFSKFLARLSKVFEIKTVQGANKVPKFIFSFNENCFKEVNEAPEYVIKQQKFRKDITERFTSGDLPYNRKDIQDVFYSLKSELLDITAPFYANHTSSDMRQELDRFIFHAYGEALENLFQAREVKSVGAYFRKLLRESIKRYLAFKMPNIQMGEFFIHLKTWGIASRFSFEEILTLQNK